MPPKHDSGISYENFGPWVGTSVALAFVVGLVERSAPVSASLVALGDPIAYIPYTLFGMAYRPWQSQQLHWDELLHPLSLLAMICYFGFGFLLSILPALAGSTAIKYLSLARRRA